MKSTLILAASLLIQGLSVSTAAAGGPRVGNGGGAWVCQDRETKAYRWMRVVDLFEAENEFGLSIRESREFDPWVLLEERLKEVRENVPELKGILTTNANQLKRALKILPEGTTLTRIDDGVIRVLPSPSTCSGGYLYYGQLANFTDDGRLLVDGDLWAERALTPLDRAALLLHEMIYKSLRDRKGETNSSRTREIVGYLFSTLDSREIRARVVQALARPAPKEDGSEVVLDAFEIHCRATFATNERVDYSQYVFPSPLPPGQAYQARLDEFEFHVETDARTGLLSKLAIFDRRSNVSTSLSGHALEAVLLKNKEVGIALERGARGESAILSCELKINKPQRG